MAPHVAKRCVIVAWIIGAMSVSIADAQVYRCTDANGRTTYSDSGCASADRSHKLSSDTASGRSGTTVCAQLQDERQRLAAESDRDARRGRTESSSHARKRQALAKQYAERCVGISRSGEK